MTHEQRSSRAFGGALALVATAVVVAAVYLLRAGAGEPRPQQVTPAPEVVEASLARAAAQPPVAVAPPRRPSHLCGEGYADAPGDRCLPIDPATRRPYSEERMKRFDQMRAGPFIGGKNFFVPKVMTIAEVTRRRAQLAHINDLGDKIRGKAAREEEIEEFFAFRGRILSYKRQLVAYDHAQGGGSIARHDPVLDPAAIEDPVLLERYQALAAEQRRDYEQKMRARREHGLPAETFVEMPEPRRPDEVPARL